MLAASAAAQVVGFDLDFRGPAAEGRAFDDVGSYERLYGRVRLALDPQNPFNRRIVDLDLAPRNAAGRVEADADVVILQPTDPARRRGTALVEVCNRGGRAAVAYFDRDAGSRLDRAADFGDGLLMRMGLTIVWVGWQQDVPRRDGLLRLRGPTLRGADGEPIEGLCRADWVVDAPTARLGIGHHVFHFGDAFDGTTEEIEFDFAKPKADEAAADEPNSDGETTEEADAKTEADGDTFERRQNVPADTLIIRAVAVERI